MRACSIVWCLHLSLACATAWAADKAEVVGLSAETSRFSWDNDFYFFRDAQFSNIFSYQHYSAVTPSLKNPDLWYRQSWAVQQTIHTPQMDTPIQQRNQDVPFVGSLILQHAWYHFDHRQLDAVAVSVGVAGPLSGAEQTQEVVHNIRDLAVFEGWSEQYPSELILNIHMLKKRKLNLGQTTKLWDMSVGVGGGFGNLSTHLAAELEFRLGQDLPAGFAYVPNTFGYHIHTMANRSSADSLEGSLYMSLMLQLNLIAHQLYLDGSLIQSSAKSYKEPIVGLGVLAIHYETLDYGLHFSILRSSQNVQVSQAKHAIGYEYLGALTYDWRY
ncbi:MAG: DUF2219 family protein [Mariprofundaceae bacterium]|nr:DUF2219 family protein [Mariprofundaceae bacterium]